MQSGTEASDLFRLNIKISIKFLHHRSRHLNTTPDELFDFVAGPFENLVFSHIFEQSYAAKISLSIRCRDHKNDVLSTSRIGVPSRCPSLAV